MLPCFCQKRSKGHSCRRLIRYGNFKIQGRDRPAFFYACISAKTEFAFPKTCSVRKYTDEKFYSCIFCQGFGQITASHQHKTKSLSTDQLSVFFKMSASESVSRLILKSFLLHLILTVIWQNRIKTFDEKLPPLPRGFPPPHAFSAGNSVSASKG